MMPYNSMSSILGPYIVWVFPDEVCPYAKIVPLKPSKTESMIGFAATSYTYFC